MRKSLSNNDRGPTLVTKTKMASNRQPVAKGGIWSSHAAPVSPQTQQLLKSNIENPSGEIAAINITVVDV